ncbi:MAG: acyl-CoA dehydrogenase family protein [Sphingopyxis sp.]
MAKLSEEQIMLRDMAQNWVRGESPVSAWRAVRDAGGAAGYDPAVYAEMAAMGWTGIIIPEAHGGVDFGWMSLGLVAEECARTLTASPLLASAIAASAIILGGDEAQKARYLPAIASGELVATLAVDETPRHDPAAISASVSDGKITGTKMFVAEGDSAGLFVVAAREDGKTGLYLVDGDAAGVARARRRMVDFRSHAEIAFNGVAADRLMGGGDALLANVLDRARIITSCEMFGMTLQAFDTTLDYLKQRVQFGQVLATFQALQHRMAGLFTEIELTRSAIEAALTTLDSGGDTSQAAALAKSRANDTLHLMSREAVQLHGGIGMTDEYDIGFTLKRARPLEQAWGSSSFLRDHFARLGGY